METYNRCTRNMVNMKNDNGTWKWCLLQLVWCIDNKKDDEVEDIEKV